MYLCVGHEPGDFCQNGDIFGNRGNCLDARALKVAAGRVLTLPAFAYVSHSMVGLKTDRVYSCK